MGVAVILLRLAGAIMSALATATFFAVDFAGLKPEVPWSGYALAAFVIFAVFVGWGWGTSEWRLYKRRHSEKQLLELAKLRTEGVKRRNTGLQITNDVDTMHWWYTQITPWIAEVKALMNTIDPADGETWNTLDTVESTQLGSRTLETLNMSPGLLTHYLDMTSKYITKLFEYIDARTKL